MAQPHWHQTSLVDLEVKSATCRKHFFIDQPHPFGSDYFDYLQRIEVMMKGAFQILAQLNADAPPCVECLGFQHRGSLTRPQELLASGLGSGAVATVGSFGGVLPWSQKLRQQRFAADLRTTVWRQAKET